MDPDEAGAAGERRLEPWRLAADPGCCQSSIVSVLRLLHRSLSALICGGGWSRCLWDPGPADGGSEYFCERRNKRRLNRSLVGGGSLTDSR